MTGATNLLVIVLDALRRDAAGATLDAAGRTCRAETALASAPWTLPSCTSLLTGLDAPRHGRYWHDGRPAGGGLVQGLPRPYRKIGIVNNTVLLPASGLHLGFDRWTYVEGHAEPFERAAAQLRRARARRPQFLFVHSNISHDYYLPPADRYFDEAFPGEAGGACLLGDRVIGWDSTTPDDRAAVARTYEASARTALAAAGELLALARARDDVITVVLSDHGEGLDYDVARVHHGGRLHDDLLRIPLLVDLPSSTPEPTRRAIADALASKLVAITDVLPSLLAWAGGAVAPGVDGAPITATGGRPVVVSEDRRYLYFGDRFRFNFKGRGKHMSASAAERNRTLLAKLAGPAVLRSYRSATDKLIMTCLWPAEAPGSPAEARRRWGELGLDLLGDPLVARANGGIYAFELFDLVADPAERVNLLRADGSGTAGFDRVPWSGSVAAPADPVTGAEIGLRDLVRNLEPLGG